jgi:hypothetical protein
LLNIEKFSALASQKAESRKNNYKELKSIKNNGRN